MYRNLTLFFACSVLSLFALTGVGFGADFQSMTTEELSKLRGTMYNATQEERDAFRAEWMSRINQMTDEEKSQYFGPGGGRGQGNRNATGLGDGQGRGKGGGQGNGIGPDAGGTQGSGKGGNKK